MARQDQRHEIRILRSESFDLLNVFVRTLKAGLLELTYPKEVPGRFPGARG